MDENSGATEVAGEESGSALRQKLEAEIAARKAAETANSELAAQVVILQGGFDRLSPQDLAGIPTNELATKAAELQTAKATEAETLFRAEALKRGIQLPVQETVDEPSTPPSGWNRVASLGTLGGTPPGQIVKQPKGADELLESVWS